jgi:NitT/TauT family transport system substrate-binding protein
MKDSISGNVSNLFCGVWRIAQGRRGSQYGAIGQDGALVLCSCRRTIEATLVIILALYSVAPAALGQTKEMTRIRIANPGPSLSYFPVYVALKKDLFKKYGIDAEFVQMTSGPTSVAALMNREIDYTTLLGPSAGAAVNGAPIKIICFTSVKLQHSIIARPEIHSVKELSGKKIGVGRLRDLTWYEVQFLIKKYDLQNTTIVAGGQNQRNLQAVQAGALDAAVISVPLDIKAEEMGLRRLIRMGEILPIPQVGLAASEDKIRKNRDEVIRVLKATIEGLGYIKSNRQDVVEIISKWINLTPAQAEKAFASVEDTFSRDCIPTAEQANAYLPMLKVTTEAKEDIAPATVFSFSLAEAAAKELSKK